MLGTRKWLYLSKGLSIPFKLKDNLYLWKFSRILMRFQMSGRIFAKCALYPVRNSFGFKNGYGYFSCGILVYWQQTAFIF